MKHPVVRRVCFAILAVLLAAVLVVGGYILYLQLQYYRIDDHTPLTVSNPAEQTLQKGGTYTAATYNIGFGAYNQEFSFFMDTGHMADGTYVSGKSGRAADKETVLTDTAGDAAALAALSPDFCLLQEVDSDSTRSYGVDQRTWFTQNDQGLLPGYAFTYAVNFHSAYLFYPLQEPHGRANSGLLTLSRYEISSAERRSYPVDESFPTKFFDLDRCFSLHRLPVEDGKELVLINSHMSAYDKGGLVRTQQLALLSAVLSEEYAKGNYVIVGGDYNHILDSAADTFPSEQLVPEWVASLSPQDLPDGFSIVKATNCNTVPTCRTCDIPYTKGVNYTAVLDGFIVSDNVTASAENIDLDFQYSDHNPVLLTFTLQ